MEISPGRARWRFALPTTGAREPLVTYMNDVTSAMTQAKEAAGVLVHGAGTAQLALAAGVLDERELHVIPVLFSEGRRLFEGLAAEQIELQRTRILEGRPASPTCTTGSGAPTGTAMSEAFAAPRPNAPKVGA